MPRMILPAAPLLLGLMLALTMPAALPADAQSQRPHNSSSLATPRTQPAAAKPAPDHEAPDVGRPGDVVTFAGDYPQGSVVIVNKERRLYYVLGGGKAIRYPIAIGTEANQWTGNSFVRSKVKDPTWIPPWDPENVVPAGPANPLGPRAIYLDWSTYRIHGNNAPHSIGRAASHGCFRMHNHHVKDLYERVHIGAPIYVLSTL